MGLYVQAALMAHDCVANTMITIDECKNLKVFACVDIKAGEIVYNNYTTVLLVSTTISILFTMPKLNNNFTNLRERKHVKII